MPPRIERKDYLDKLIRLRDLHVIKVITGVRRCGKSTMLEIYQDYLRAQGVREAQMVWLNLEDFDNAALRDAAKLHEYVKMRILTNETTYIFIDEVQQCAEFPAVIDSLFLRKNVDIYITGSNAYMLSSEIATMLSGRYVEIRMMPLSFREYVDAVGNHRSLSECYRDYTEYSAFPFAPDFYAQKRELREYLESIYHTIVIKDIASRKKISDMMMLESVTRFLFDSIGSPISSKKIADTMTSGGRKIDVKTVEKYMDGLTESFVFYEAKRYNVRGKQVLKTLGKYYAVDIGLRYALLGTQGVDIGHILENVIFLELKRRYGTVYVGKWDAQEIDFVIRNDCGLQYIQVAASVRDPDTLARELRPLQQIRDNHPKLLLTLDDDPDMNYDGIVRTNALSWLMGRREDGVH